MCRNKYYPKKLKRMLAIMLTVAMAGTMMPESLLYAQAEEIQEIQEIQETPEDAEYSEELPVEVSETQEMEEPESSSEIFEEPESSPETLEESESTQETTEENNEESIEETAAESIQEAVILSNAEQNSAEPELIVADTYYLRGSTVPFAVYAKNTKSENTYTMDLYVDDTLFQEGISSFSSYNYYWYGIEAAEIAAGTHKIKAELKLDGTTVASVEKDVVFAADAPRTEMKYTGQDVSYVLVYLYATSGLLEGKTVKSMELYDASDKLAAYMANNVNSYTGKYVDERYDGVFESTYPYYTETVRYSAQMTWIKKTPDLGKYKLRVIYEDGTKENYADAAEVTEEPYISYVYPEGTNTSGEGKNNYDGYVYLQIQGCNLTKQDIVPVFSAGEDKLESEVVNSTPYSNSEIVLKVKKVNWPSDVNSVKVSLQDASGNLLKGESERTFSIEDNVGFYFGRYNYATNLVEVYATSAMQEGSTVEVSFATDYSGENVVAEGTGTVQNGVMTVQPMQDSEPVNLVNLLGTGSTWLYMSYAVPGETQKSSLQFCFIPSNELSTSSDSVSTKAYRKVSDTKSISVGYTYRKDSVGECKVNLYDSDNQLMVSQDMQVKDYTDSNGYYYISATLALQEELAEGTYRVDIVENDTTTLVTKNIRVIADDVEVLTSQYVYPGVDGVSLSVTSTIAEDSKVTVTVTDLYGNANTYDAKVDNLYNSGTAYISIPDLKASALEYSSYYFKVSINGKEPLGADYAASYYADERGKLATLNRSVATYGTYDNKIYRVRGVSIYDESQFPVTVQIFDAVDTEPLKTITIDKEDTTEDSYGWRYTLTADDLAGLNLESGYYTMVAVSKNGEVTSCRNRLLYGKGIATTPTTQDKTVYTVSFDGNGADAGNMDDMTFVYGTGQKLTANAYSRTGYCFSGWNTKANGKGTAYADGQTVNNLTKEANGVVTLYAQWKVNTYTVVYAKGASDATGAAMKNQTFTYDKIAALTANTYKRTGYVFDGWTDEYANVYEDRQQVVNLSEENGATVTLTARWKPVEYKITYVNAADGKNGVTNVNPIGFAVETGKTITLQNPERPGYEFGGWYSTKGFTGDKLTSIDCSKAANVTVYAKWIAKETIIKFVDNVPEKAPQGSAVSGTMRDLKVTYGKTKALTKNAYKLKGYTFDGWNTKPDGTGTAYKDAAALKEAMELLESAETTLYAQWKAVEYSITYVNGVVSDKSGVTQNANTAVFTVESGEIPLVNPVRPGYVFDGWYSKSSLKEGDRMTAIPVSAITKAANIKIYAKWIAQKAEVEFHANAPEGLTATGSMKALSVTYGKTKSLTKNAYKVAGYSFVGWSTVKNPGEGDLLLKDRAVIPASLVEQESVSEKDTASVTLYAQWELTRYSITYVNAVAGKNGVTVNDNPADYNLQEENIELKDPVRPGYIFGGWYSKSSMKETDKITQIDISGMTRGAKVKVYAKWTGKTAAVVYDSNRPANAPESAKVSGTMKTLNVTYGKIKKLTANKYKITGYTFNGWNTKQDGSGESYANKAVIPVEFVEENGSTITLYAQWKPLEYKINYVNAVNGKDGVVNENPTTYTVETSWLSTIGSGSGQNTLRIQSPTKTGYTFGGWYTDKKLTNEVEIMSVSKSKSVTLYAKWTANSYRIVYDANGGEGTMAARAATYDKNLMLSANRFQREGYSFAGWSTVAAPGEEDVIYKNMGTVKNLSTESNGTVTLYAQWKAK